MSYILNIPFENLGYQQGNCQTSGTANFSSLKSVDSKIHLGSNWVKVSWDRNGDKVVDDNDKGSTVYNVGRIRIKVSDLSIGTTGIVGGSSINFSIKNTSTWCGAGYLKAYVTTEAISLEDAIYHVEGIYKPEQALEEANHCTIRAQNFSWSTAASGKTITFSGSVNKKIELQNIEYLYIYIFDTVHNFGNPGSTTSIFNDNYLKVWFDLSYTPVGDPTFDSKVSISIDNNLGEDSNGNKMAYYDSKIVLKFNAPAGGSNNPVTGYTFWYKDYVTQEEKQFYPLQSSFSIVKGQECEYFYIGLDQIPEETRTKTYSVGVRALAQNENLHSQIVYLGNIKIINSAPQLPDEIISDKKIRCNIEKGGEEEKYAISTLKFYNKHSNSFGSDIDLLGDSSELLTYFYAAYPNEQTVSYIEAVIEGIKANEEITLDKLQSKLGTDIKWKESQASIEQNKEFLSLEMSQDRPYLYIFAKDTSGDTSPVKAFLIEINEQPEISISYTVKNSNLSFNGLKMYIQAIEDIDFELSDDRQVQYSIYGQIGEDQYYLDNDQGMVSAWDLTKSEKNYGKQIKIKIEIFDLNLDSFSQEFSLYVDLTAKKLIPYCKPPKLNVNGAIFKVETYGEGVAEDKYLHYRSNWFEFSANLNGEDSVTTYSYFLSDNDDIDDKKLSPISPTFDYVVTHGGIFPDEEDLVSVIGWDSSGLEYNKDYFLKCKVTDRFGQVEYVCLKKYQVLPKFNVGLPPAIFSFSPENWWPLYTNSKDSALGLNPQDELVFNCRWNDNNDTGINKYNLYVSIDGGPSFLIGEKLFLTPEDETRVDGYKTSLKNTDNTINFSIENIELFKKLGLNTGDKDRQLTFTIVGVNAHGVTGDSLDFVCNLKTRHAPFWVGVGEAEAKIIIDSNEESYSGDKFNHGETIKFTLGRAIGNYNDVWWGWEDGNFTTKERPSVSECLVTVSGRNEQCSKDIVNNNTYLNEVSWDSVPDFTDNIEQREIIFQIQLVNKFSNEDGTFTSLFSDIDTDSCINLIACRKTQPIAQISTASYDENSKEIIVNLSISDFGGLDDMSNFTRLEKLSEFEEEKTSFTIYASTTGEPTEQNQIQEIKPSSVKNSDLSRDIQLKFKNTQLDLQKIWIQVKINIQTNGFEKDDISTITATYLFYVGGPTMSHRPHWVGINTKNYTEGTDEVFKVSKFDIQDKIKLIGTFSEGESVYNMDIVIDLTNGIISGINSFDNKTYTIDLRNGQFTGDINIPSLTSSNIESDSIIIGKIISGETVSSENITGELKESVIDCGTW